MILNGFKVYETDATIQNKMVITNINGDFKLECGDIIVRKGHIHIYLGEGYGISDNFGWGKVNRVFPQKYNYELKTDDGINYYIVCDKDIDYQGTPRKYQRVYRYIGGYKDEKNN